MTTKEIIFYIIIPLLSALLGGGLTLLGVLITVNRNNKDRKEDEIKKINRYYLSLKEGQQKYQKITRGNC